MRHGSGTRICLCLTLKSVRKMYPGHRVLSYLQYLSLVCLFVCFLYSFSFCFRQILKCNPFTTCSKKKEEKVGTSYTIVPHDNANLNTRTHPHKHPTTMIFICSAKYRLIVHSFDTFLEETACVIQRMCRRNQTGLKVKRSTIWAKSFSPDLQTTRKWIMR